MEDTDVAAHASPRTAGQRRGRGFFRGVVGTVAVAAGRGSAVTTGVAVFTGVLGALVAVTAGSVGSFAGSPVLGDFAHPTATRNVSAIPMTTAMKNSGASDRNRRKRAT